MNQKKESFKCNCLFMEKMDLFAKNPELYFKRKPQKSTTIGKIFTIIYGLIYLAFFIYKIIRMVKKEDVSFYDTETFTGEIPSLHLDNDLFYGGFALVNPLTGNTYIDETIYYPKAEFRMGKKIDNVWQWEYKDIGIEQCDISKFGSKYRDLFSDKIDNLYCLSEMDFTLEGHTTYDIYSYFYVAFYPCVNGVNGKTNCQPYDTIKTYLRSTMLTVKMQDIELTPQIYSNPIQERTRELSAPVMADLYNNINAYFHIVSIETDNDVLGFEALSDVDVKRFFKYDVTFMVTNTNANDILATGEPLCNILLQLTEQMLTINRTYTKLIEVLGDVGGLMEFIFSFFKILAIFLTNTLYEKSLINSLFSFDINKKVIVIKNQNKVNKIKFSSNNDAGIYTPVKSSNKQSTINSIGNEEILRTNSRLNEVPSNKNTLNNEINKKTKKINNSKRPKYKSKTNHIKLDTNEVKINNNLEKKDDQDIKNINRMSTNLETENNHKEKIDKIHISKIDIYLCCFCARKKKNIQNALIDEGMKMICEKLDIINLFIKLHRDEILQEKFNNEDIIEMSDECKQNLHDF